MTDPLRIEKLRVDHVVAGFDCGREELNRFLVHFALVNQQSGTAQTYLAVSGDSVVGYDSLAVGEVAYDDAPSRLSKELARHPVPIMLLARLAMGAASQGRALLDFVLLMGAWCVGVDYRAGLCRDVAFDSTSRCLRESSHPTAIADHPVQPRWQLAFFSAL